MLQTTHHSRKRGIFFILLAMLIFALLNAIIKDSTAHYHPIQIVFFTCFFSAVPAACFLIIRGEWLLPRSTEWKIHFKRAGLLAIGLSILFLGMSMLPLANSMALYFSSTFFLVILSRPILSEKVDLAQWVAVAVGFVGVLIVAKPNGVIFNWGTLLMIAGAFMESSYNLYGRLLSSTYNNFMLTFLGTLLPALVILSVLPFVWITPNLEGWIILVFLGLGSGLAQLCVTFAYRYAPAGVLSPMIYSAMLWSVILDITYYGNWPTVSLILGSGIIITSGLIILIYEKKNVKTQLELLQANA